MSRAVLEQPQAQAQAQATLRAASPVDLAELIASFNEVTGRLQDTHEALRSEVARLEGELREAQAQLGRARELAALGEMAAGIAHEVRNPLGSIRLYASMLTQDLADRPAERAVAQKIAAAVSRLDAVVGDVLAFARPLTVRGELLEAAQLIRESVDACADLWPRHGVTVHPPRRDQTLWCDPLLMQQAMVNVLRNAAEALSECGGGNIWIECSRRRVADTSGERRPMSVLSVRDDGPGVPQSVLERVFNPFFTTRHTGTGLGLAIVHRILDAHGGRVSIRNNGASSAAGAPPRGATVEFLIPARHHDVGGNEGHARRETEHVNQREAA
ncbi:MAG: ATP-binding protein [Planctomycetota bacterium]|nr:ATP-binding protein [Planctomycetota bacterium]